MDEVLPVTPKVAAILIAHNQAAELRRALEALERSVPRELLEILVVDCASEDDTRGFADEFPGDGSPNVVAGANHRDRGIPALHVTLH